MTENVYSCQFSVSNYLKKIFLYLNSETANLTWAQEFGDGLNSLTSQMLVLQIWKYIKYMKLICEKRRAKNHHNY